MNQDVTQPDLHQKTQQLLEGPLKHVKAAALAAALLPLASVAAAPAAAQGVCPASAGVCGTVFADENANGIFDLDEVGIGGVKVTVHVGTDRIDIETDPDGRFEIPDLAGGQEVMIAVLIPTGAQASPQDVGLDDGVDSDGEPNGAGYSVVTIVVNGTATDFGLVFPNVAQPGTGTPGYWKNHPEAWPVNSIVVGGVMYTRDQAIAWLKRVGKDKTTTMFSSLVPAMLNVMIGNDGSCVNAAIEAADTWMAKYGPVGRNVHASSAAWSEGEPYHIILDNYNNGRLCAPHRE